MQKRWLWVQDYSDRILTSKAQADAFVALVSRKFSDVMISVRADNDARVWFTSKLTETRPERIDGQLGGAYLTDKLHTAGVRVHAWFYVGFWYTYTKMHNPPPAEWNLAFLPEYNTNWANFSIEGMRQKIADHVADIANTSGLDGVHLDYLRLNEDNLDSPLITYKHVTDVARRVRAGIGSKMMSAAFSGRGADVARQQRRDVWTWLQEPGLFDALQMMSYVSVPLDDKLAWARSLPDPSELIVPGVPTFYVDDTGRSRPSAENCSYHTLWWIKNSYQTQLAYFDSMTLTAEMVNALPELVEPEPEPELSGCLSLLLGWLTSL